MAPPWTSRQPAARTAAASAAACLLVALLAPLLLENVRLRRRLDEKDALIDEKDALIRKKNALIEDFKAQLDQQRAIIEALQAKESVGLVRSGPLQAPPTKEAKDAAAHLAATICHEMAGRDARGSTAQPAEDDRRLVRARRPSASRDNPRRRLPRSPGRDETEARQLSPQHTGQQCIDSPVGWVDWAGQDCHVYVQGALCTPTGGYGDGWAAMGYELFTFDDYANAGVTAPSVCCGCGGGKPCMDLAGWMDKNGNTCATYASKGYCDGDGGTGAGWPPAWGTFANQTLAGRATAATACCACRPRARDASERGCDYYAAHPAQCGCCDDEDFQAQRTCSSACSAKSAQMDLTLRLAGWTNDTRMIIFPSSGMTGRIPADWSTRFPHLQMVELSWNALEGTLPQELALLPELRVLRLGSNKMRGSIPAQLSLLKNLEYLDIKNNSLTGSVPAQLGLIKSLRVLSLHSNFLSGMLPVELGLLPLLTDLELHSNKIQATLVPELGQLASLEYLYLHDNELTGTIPPELGKLHNLMELRLYSNKFEGTLVPELGQMVSLEILSLGDNQITGTIPPELGKLHNLKELYLYSNRIQGTLVPEFGQMVSLEILHLYDNQLTGTIPPELGKLHNLVELMLYSNKIQGTLVPELVQLVGLETLYLDDNQLTGTIPPELGELQSLRALDLTGNQLEGTLPVELCSLVQLQSLAASGNMLTGTIPDSIGNLTSLNLLELHSNMFEGPLPSTFGDLVQLDSLRIYNNRFNGSLPAEMGAMAMLRKFWAGNNELSGTLPGEVIGNWSRLETLGLRSNLFEGPVPDELGLLQQVTQVDLAYNGFTSLPLEIGEMQALQVLYVNGNPSMTGAFPDTSGCPNLQAIYAAKCNFTTAGAVGAAIGILDFRGNNFAALPDSWAHLPAVTDLDLSDNNIGTWRPFGVLPPEAFYSSRDGRSFTCGYSPVQPRLNWTVMEKVNLSGNPLGDSTTARDFISSLAYLRRLTVLQAASCGLRGDVPYEGNVLAWDVPHTGDDMCRDMPANPTAGFPALLTLDLSGNDITSIGAPPSQRLSLAMLGSNALTFLNPSWYSILGNLEVWGNPLLRTSVDPPKGESGCPSAGARGLQADAFGWKENAPGDTYQCTTLCASTRTRYKHDPWLNVFSLCRCKAGQEGAATNCSGCPPDTFSESQDRWGMVRTCRPCPPLSTTDAGVQNATSADQCMCPPGWYMGLVPLQESVTPTGAGSNQTGNQTNFPTALACVRCRQQRFQTTARGAKAESQCVCNPDYEGLRALKGSCGCVDGMYMDHVAKKCRPCTSSVEECNWGASVELSLLPPVVRQGYWAEPWADSEAGNFSENDIWRCVSKETCKEGGVCAEGRQGRSCSLCSAGMYGGPDGPCRRCPNSPAESQQALLLVLLIGPAATLAAHLLLQGSDSRWELASSLQLVRTSAKQVLKYLQMLGVVSVFNVRWPPAARNFFTSITHIIVTLPEVAGVACLSGQQTATLEMGFRWLLPVAGLASACLTALLLLPTCWLCRECRLHAYIKMDRWDVLRVSLWGLVLFQSTVLQFGTQVLTCVPSPNGVATVLSFPHLQCTRGEEEWEQLAGISAAFLAAFVLAVFAAVYAAWRRTVFALAQSGFKSRGWWGFLFSDFRSGSTQWAMLVMAKDIALVLISTAGAGDGPGQLLATAVGSTLYSYIVLRDQPFEDASNNFLEAWTAMSLASLSIFSAGMGYQATPGQKDDVEQYVLGVDDALYKSRARAMTALLWLTLLGPAVTVLYQLATLSDRVKRRLPLFLRPMRDEERRAWNDQFLASLGLEQEAAGLRGVVESFDAIDGSHFRSFMGATTATLGLVPSHSSNSIRTAGRRRMEDIARQSRNLRQPAKNNETQVSDAPGGPGAEEDEDADRGTPGPEASTLAAPPIRQGGDQGTPQPDPDALAAPPNNQGRFQPSGGVVLL